MNLYPIIILAGGIGNRLYPTTKTIPKSMIEINGEPFIQHQLNLLEINGFNNVVICVGHLGSVIDEYAKHHKFNMNITVADEGEELLGTGGCISRILSILPENFFVVYGDSYLDCDYKFVQQKFIDEKKLSLMCIYKNNGKYDRSNVEYSEGEIIGYDKSNPNVKAQYIDYGLSIFNKKAFEGFERKFDLYQVHQKMLQMNELASCVMPSRFFEIGSWSGLKSFEDFIKED
jgi:N-acetyl-alpha-D-muramate 1-phosphate uridylyltransferase